MLPGHGKLSGFAAVPLAFAAIWGAQQQPAVDPRVAIEPRPKAPAADGAKPTLRADTALVLIPVTVTDPRNRIVTGLEKANFRVYEDKIEQTITHFSSDDAPISGGVVFDCSASMGSKLLRSRQAVAQFFRTANPEDEFFLVQFSEDVRVAQAFTKSLQVIQDRLAFTTSRGHTALLDAIYMALQEMKRANNPRKALLVISDGGDNSSRYSEAEIKNLVREVDVQIYAIGIYEPIGARSRTPEEMRGPRLLTEIAEETGGRQYSVDNVNELPDVAAKIGVELRNEYVLGYTSANRERDGRYRRVEVKLAAPRGFPVLRASWRLGYYAPTD